MSGPYVFCFTCIFDLHFTGSQSRWARWSLRVFYVLRIVVAVLALLGLVATSMQVKFYGYAPVLGPAFPLYFLVSFVPTIVGLVMLFRARRRSPSANEKNRFSYVLVGVAMSLVEDISDIIPALGIQSYPLGIVGDLGFGILTTVAITIDGGSSPVI